MNWFTRMITSSLGKKLIMGLTGLFLCSFLVVHLSGNLALFNDDGGAAFNAYSQFMSTNVIIKILEVGLILGFILHIYSSIVIYFENKKARPEDYSTVDAGANSTFFSRTMIYSGLLVLVFLVIHLNTFLVPHRFTGTDLTFYQTVVYAFEDPVYSGFYVFAMILLAFHLNHGFQSAFQTLGLNHKKYTPVIQVIGLLFSIIIPAGFATMPIYFLLRSLMGGS